MELDQHVDRLREQLEIAAGAGGEEARALAQRLLAPLDSAVRLMLLDVLAVAAAEITRRTCTGLGRAAPARGRARVRRDRLPRPIMSVRPRSVPGDVVGSGETWKRGAPPLTSGGAEGGMSRVNLRLPDELKGQRRAGGGPGGAVDQRLARAGRGRGCRARSAGDARREQHAPRTWTALHGMGEVAVLAHMHGSPARNRPAEPKPLPR